MPTPKSPQDRKPKAPKPSDGIDAYGELEDLKTELLADMPALRPAHRFRLGHRNAFHDLTLEAMKSGAFDRDDLEFDMSNPEHIEAYQKLARFVESIDTWAESIAVDQSAYEEWSEGKTEEHFLALFQSYRDALGESNSSVS